MSAPGKTNDNPALFDYPAQATFGRLLPKSKVYAFGKPTRRVRDLITAQIAQIVWQYKLAPETVNIPAKGGVAEVQVFRVELKPDAVSGEDDLAQDALRCIDKAIASPIIFELVDAERVRAVAAYKRSSDADPAKWVVGDYFGTAWLPADTPRDPLPVALDMAALYEQLVRGLMPLPARRGESIRDHADRLSALAVKRRECQRLEAQLRREKQFNRKVEINAQLRSLKAELKTLTK